MTLIDAILKAKHEAGKYSSPPPETVEFDRDINRKRVYKYAHVSARVDSFPPRYTPERKLRNLEEWRNRIDGLFMENVQLLMNIRKSHFLGGRVDCRWEKKPIPVIQYYQYRVDFLKRVQRENLALYKRLLSTNARVDTTAELNRDWSRNKRKIVEQASATFVLFPPVPCDEMEDLAFKAELGVKRPRVYLKLGLQGGAVMGEICVELFTDKCPLTCRLFLELLDGNSVGHSYVNTCFFRKVPNLYWSGGDVIYNNGFGCYAQTGRTIPIGAENYHYPHSMPGNLDLIVTQGGEFLQKGPLYPVHPHAGLLSMRVTADDEMCGIFNITFKPLPQLDLRNVVFGRVIRPSSTYNIIRGLGNALSSRPVVEIRSTRRKIKGRWVNGKPNTRLTQRPSVMS